MPPVPQTYGLDPETATALRVYAERYYTGWVNAFDGLAAQLKKSGNLTESQAKQLAEAYLKNKLVKFDLVNQRFVVKHGSYWDRDVVRTALSNLVQTTLDEEPERGSQDASPGSEVPGQPDPEAPIPADEPGERAAASRQPKRLQKPDASKGSVKPVRSRQKAAQPGTPGETGTPNRRPATPPTHRPVRPVPRAPAIGKSGRKVNPLSEHPLARLGRRKHGVR